MISLRSWKWTRSIVVDVWVVIYGKEEKLRKLDAGKNRH